VIDGQDSDDTRAIVDPVHDAEVTPAGAVIALEVESKRVAHSMRVLGQPAVDELDTGSRDLLRQPVE
jgi:hypothetical protein